VPLLGPACRVLAEALRGADRLAVKRQTNAVATCVAPQVAGGPWALFERVARRLAVAQADELAAVALQDAARPSGWWRRFRKRAAQKAREYAENDLNSAVRELAELHGGRLLRAVVEGAAVSTPLTEASVEALFRAALPHGDFGAVAPEVAAAVRVAPVRAAAGAAAAAPAAAAAGPSVEDRLAEMQRQFMAMAKQQEEEKARQRQMQKQMHEKMQQMQQQHQKELAAMAAKEHVREAREHAQQNRADVAAMRRELKDLRAKMRKMEDDDDDDGNDDVDLGNGQAQKQRGKKAQSKRGASAAASKRSEMEERVHVLEQRLEDNERMTRDAFEEIARSRADDGDDDDDHAEEE